MNFAKVLPLVMVAILLLAARFAANLPQVDQKAEIEKLARQQAEEKLQRLAGTCLVLVAEDDYAVLYPDQPRQDQFILIGSNDDDWHLHWHYDTSFYSERSEVEDDDGPPRLDADGVLLRDAMQRLVKDRNHGKAGKPEEWVVQTERDLTHLETYPVCELTYSYRKYTTELPREGRVWKIKVPGAVVTLHVDGEPEVVNSPLVESFFQSFDYLPRPN